MKKLCLIFMFLLIISSFMACTDNGSELTSNDEITTNDAAPAFGEKDKITEETKIPVKEDFLIVADDADLNLPIIREKFTYDHAGATFEVDDDIELLVESNLTTYLELLGIRYDKEIAEFDDKIATLDYKLSSGTYIYAKPNTIVFSFDAEDFNINPKEEDILSLIKSDTYLSAMCKFNNITEPCVKIEQLEEVGVTGKTVVIYQEADSKSQRILNSEFNCVEIWMYEESDHVTYCCYFIDTKNTEENAEIVYYSDAVLSAKNEGSGTIEQCEIRYHFDAQTGCYIPYYEFYHGTENGATTEVTYVKTKVPMYKNLK